MSDDWFPCPACDKSTKSLLLYRVNGCEIHQCADCGLGRTEAVEFDAAAFYNDDYFSGKRDDGYADYRGSERVLRREFRSLVDSIYHLVPGGSLLEIGCAFGFFLKEANERFDVAGLEVSESAVNACRSAGLNVISGEVSDASFDGLGMFDVIVLLDVIEHLPRPAEAIDLCAAHLNEGGAIILSTGDFASAAARITGARWRLMTPPQHLWFFTPASIRQLAASSGLELESLRHPWKLVPLSLVAFQLKRILRMKRMPRRIPDIGMPVNLFDAMRVVLRKSAA